MAHLGPVKNRSNNATQVVSRDTMLKVLEMMKLGPLDAQQQMTEFGILTIKLYFDGKDKKFQSAAIEAENNIIKSLDSSNAAHSGNSWGGNYNHLNSGTVQSKQEAAAAIVELDENTALTFNFSISDDDPPKLQWAQDTTDETKALFRGWLDTQGMKITDEGTLIPSDATKTLEENSTDAAHIGGR